MTRKGNATEDRGGTSMVPMYACVGCRDSGQVLTRDMGADVEVGLSQRAYKFIQCPACDRRSRLCGEVDEMIVYRGGSEIHAPGGIRDYQGAS